MFFCSYLFNSDPPKAFGFVAAINNCFQKIDPTPKSLKQNIQNDQKLKLYLHPLYRRKLALVYLPMDCFFFIYLLYKKHIPISPCGVIVAVLQMSLSAFKAQFCTDIT